MTTRSANDERSDNQLRIAQLRRTIDDVLRPLIPPGQDVALVDFPNYPNVGDSAIWLGEAAWLRSNGNRRRYVCEGSTYRASTLRTLLPEGPILISGGGNFGDLWPEHHALRERVVQDFPDRHIIQLPQSIHFSDPHRLEAARRVFGTHPHVTILVRDRRSLEIATSAFGSRVGLCPDMAMLLQLRCPIRPIRDLVGLKRTDKESAHAAMWDRLPSSCVTMDWLEDRRDWGLRVAQYYPRLCQNYPIRFAPFSAMVADLIARWRVRRGVLLLAEGRRVVTDRLHAHILCLLMGIPHDVIDNSYGKLSSFIQTWTDGTCRILRESEGWPRTEPRVEDQHDARQLLATPPEGAKQP